MSVYYGRPIDGPNQGSVLTNLSSPKYRDGQVVKIATMEGWADGDEELVGSMFTVNLVGPAQHDGRWVWEYCGWIDKYEESWCFPEQDLQPMNGVAQIEDIAPELQLSFSTPTTREADKIVEVVHELGCQLASVSRRTPAGELEVSLSVTNEDLEAVCCLALTLLEHAFIVDDDGWRLHIEGQASELLARLGLTRVELFCYPWGSPEPRAWTPDLHRP